jgi:small subunit ribosomal protein S5
VAENENTLSEAHAVAAAEARRSRCGISAAPSWSRRCRRGRGGDRGRRAPDAGKTPFAKRDGDEFAEKIDFHQPFLQGCQGRSPLSSFSALVVVGDKTGQRRSWRSARRRKSRDAIKRGGELARTRWQSCLLEGRARFPARGLFRRYGGAKILLAPRHHPAPASSRAKRVRAVFESAGVKDVLTKSLGSRTLANVVKATLNASAPASARREQILKAPRFGNQKS